MNAQQINSILGVVIGCISVIGTFVAVSQFYRNRIKEMINRNASAATKAYAAERDFNHLQRNYQQLQTSLDQLMREIDLRVEKLEIRFVRTETLMRLLTKEITENSVLNLIDKDED